MRKVIECSRLGELFCGNTEEKSVERNADDGDLSYEVAEGSLRVKGYWVHCNICYFELRFYGSYQLGLKNQK